MTLLHFDITQVLPAIGYAGLAAIVFAESGLFFGFFLPGDSVLFSAGLLASHGTFNIITLVVLISAAAVLGDSAGYWFGSLVGQKLFSRNDSLLFHKRHLEETHRFYEKYGASAVILARFVPIVRTFAPILAGVGRMRYSLFLRYNVIGGCLWGAGVTLLGYFLGQTFPAVDQYLTLVIALIILVSFLPIALQWWRARNRAR